MIKKIDLLFTALFFLITLEMISAIPMPCAFYGEVKYNGSLIPNGYTIDLKINNVTKTQCRIIDGKYGYGSNACIVNSDNNMVNVNFYIQNLKIGNATFMDKEIIRIDFELEYLPELPSQGQNQTNQTTPPNGQTSSGSSGGGGGGSRSSGTTKVQDQKTTQNTSIPIKENCVEQWVCKEWSNPEEECGVRGCTDINNCGTTLNKPITVKECPEKKSSIWSLITGAFLSNITKLSKSKISWLILVIVILLIILFYLIFIFKKRKNKKKIAISRTLNTRKNIAKQTQKRVRR